MKTPYRHIYKVLRLNRFIVLTVVLIAFLSSGFSLYQVRSIHQQMIEKSFAVSPEGAVMPLELVNKEENLAVEAKSHLARFHRYFYDLNTSNYESHLEKALWLGNQSVDEVYRQKKADGVYNRLLQYSLVQKVTSITSEVELQKAPYSFKTVVRFEINRGTVTDHYELITSGELIKIERHFPRNPHGLLITNFFENSLKRIENENR